MGFSDFISTVTQIIGSKEVILVVQSCSFIFKIFLLSSLYTTIQQQKSSLWKYLFVVITASLVEDFSWVMSLSHKLFFSEYSYFPVLCSLRIAWIFNIIMYQSLYLFIESFKSKNLKFTWYHYCILAPSFLFFMGFTVILFTGYDSFESSLRSIESMYALLFLMPFTYLSTFYDIHRTNLPKIIKLQLKTCLRFFLLPHLLANLLQVYPFNFAHNMIAGSLAAVSISTIFLSLTLYHCVKKIIGLRFLNVHNHVQDETRFNFIDDFKIILEKLGTATNIREIKLLTQQFFHKAFAVDLYTVQLIIRPDQTKKLPDIHEHNETVQAKIENFIYLYNFHKDKNSTPATVKETIFIYDEIAYNEFHDPQEWQKITLDFLDEIGADIFLPLYEQNTIIGGIIVSRSKQEETLYTNIERDEMLVFASYLSKILHLLHNRNLEELLKQKKDLLEELYQKHQEVSQYKESIRSFLRTQKEQGTGLIFYKNRKFIMGNQLASEMLTLNPNTQEGYPLTKKLKNLTFQVEMYRTPQSFIATNTEGKKIIVTGFPYPEHNGAIITLQYPEISDTLKQLVDCIKDPSDWDYLLYLETTQSGRLISNLIPSNSEFFLNFKIDLLRLSLTKKALFLDLPEDDLLPIVKLIHSISLRENLHILELQSACTPEQAIEIFGVNTLFYENKNQSLLEKLNKNGTLFIKNAHFLDYESQKNLAHLIKYGFYKLYKSDKKVQSDVRIIFSSNHTLSELVKTGRFSEELFNELRTTSLVFPSLKNIHAHELETLIDGFNQEALQESDYNQLLVLTEKEKSKIAKQRPTSFYEIKKRVHYFIKHKYKDIEPEKHSLKTYAFDPTLYNNDPQLIQAAKLGKKALKNKEIMLFLWDTFKNQNKIATFLGVNRSSVHRRCKDYNINSL